MLLLPLSAQLFVPGLHQGVVVRQTLRSGGIGMASKPLSVDVSDLGVTMDDLKMPINSLEVEASGCESTSRISPDTGCVWSETASRVEARSQKRHHPGGRGLAPHRHTPASPDSATAAATPRLRVVVPSAQPAATRAQATLTIPGLLGQPADSLAVEMTETTATITAFGRAVWSCVRAAGREHGPTGAGRRKSPKRPASCSGPAWGPLRRRTPPAAPPGRETAACATFSLPDPGAPWLGGSGLRADRGGAGRAADDAHAARGDPHRRQGAERPLGRADQADRGR